MKIAFKTSQEGIGWKDLANLWVEADGIDVFEGGWLFDHFSPLWGDPAGPCFEAWTIAAGLAAITSRLRIGHMVTSNTHRHPAVVANMVTTLDHISGGRFDFGFGAGWLQEEHDAYGIPLPPLRERFDRFDEALEVVHLLLTEATADFAGDYYQLTGARCEPKPVQQPRPPIAIGGQGEKRLLRSAARWADHYNLVSSDVDEFRRKLEVLARHCEDLGRDVGSIETSMQIRTLDIDEAVAIAAAAREAGASRVIFYLPPPSNLATLERLAVAASVLA